MRREALPDGLEREAAAGAGVEDRAEHAGGVEALGAEPVDRALVADERHRVEVADDAVILDRQVTLGGPFMPSPLCRRHARHLGGTCGGMRRGEPRRLGGEHRGAHDAGLVLQRGRHAFHA